MHGLACSIRMRHMIGGRKQQNNKSHDSIDLRSPGVSGGRAIDLEGSGHRSGGLRGSGHTSGGPVGSPGVVATAKVATRTHGLATKWP